MLEIIFMGWGGVDFFKVTLKISRSWGERVMGSHYLMGTGFQFRKTKEFWR